jgi:hypothetical protein
MPGQVAWQGGIFRYGEAYVDYVDVGQPAAGSLAALSVPGQFGVIVLAARATLTTSATVANREVSLDVVNANGVTRWRNPAPAVQAAGVANQRYEWNGAWANALAIANGPVVMPVLDVIVPPAWSIQFSVDLIAAGDQLANLSLTVLKVPTGA